MAKPKTDTVLAHLNRAFPFILIGGGVIGLVCSFILAQDELELARNPKFIPSCNLNPVLSCGNVIRTHQAALFGFPNPWIGLVAFGIFLMIGIMLLAGGNVKHWFWQAFTVGTGLAMLFAYWLLVQSVFVIQALCPFCLIVDVAMTTIFWYGLLYVIENSHLTLPARLSTSVNFARKHHLEILITWFLLLVALILQHFWYYYGQFI